MLIDISKEHILNGDELFEEAFQEFQKKTGFVIIARNHFHKGTFIHVDCYTKISLKTLTQTAATCYSSIPINKKFVHEERIYRREDKKLLFRTAAI